VRGRNVRKGKEEVTAEESFARKKKVLEQSRASGLDSNEKKEVGGAPSEATEGELGKGKGKT